VSGEKVLEDVEFAGGILACREAGVELQKRRSEAALG